MEFEPKLENITNELSLSSYALRRTFVELLDKQRIDFKDVDDAYIKFFFYDGHWPAGAYIKVKAQAATIEHAVDQLGVTAKIIHGNS